MSGYIYPGSGVFSYDPVSDGEYICLITQFTLTQANETNDPKKDGWYGNLQIYNETVTSGRKGKLTSRLTCESKWYLENMENSYYSHCISNVIILWQHNVPLYIKLSYLYLISPMKEHQGYIYIPMILIHIRMCYVVFINKYNFLIGRDI